jgi:hypothetical protein
MKRKLISMVAMVFLIAMLPAFASATEYTCNSCSSCAAYLVNSSDDDVIKLTQNITAPGGGPGEESCIVASVAGDNKTFDCQGYSLSTAGGGAAVGLDGSFSNMTIKNCVITSSASVGISFQGVSGSNNTIDNVTISAYNTGILWYSNALEGRIINTNITGAAIQAIQLDSAYNGIGFTTPCPDVRDSYLSSSGICLELISCGLGNYSGNIFVGGTAVDLNCEGCGPGSCSTFSKDNLFYNNLFNTTTHVTMGDCQQASEYLNAWNVTEQAGVNIFNPSNPNIAGNFWATPTGTGFSEGCADADGDGFCDSAYTFLSNSDYLPISDNYTDATPPNITIYSPQNTTYTVSSIPLNVTTDESVDTWYYDLNGTGNQSFSPNTTIVVVNGMNHIEVWGNDSSDNWGYDDVWFEASLLPTYSEFSSDPETTNFSAVPDIQNVSEPVLANSYAKVAWSGYGYDAAGADFDSAMAFSANSVDIDTATIPTFDAPATVTLKGVTYITTSQYRVLRDGSECTSCVKLSSSPATFTVPGFSTYTTEFIPATQQQPMLLIVPLIIAIALVIGFVGAFISGHLDLKSALMWFVMAGLAVVIIATIFLI